MRRLFSRRHPSAVILLPVLCVFLSACASGAQEEDYSPIVAEPPGEKAYSLASVSRDTLALTATVSCIYRQMAEETVVMPVGGKTVEKVCVEKGDRVVKGQLLIRLSGGDYEDEISRLEYNIARNTLLMEYTEKDEADDLSYRWWTYIYKTPGREADRESLEAGLQSIRQSYRYKREGYQDAIELDTLRLEELCRKMEQSRVYAGTDGEISYVKEGLEGAKAVEGESVLRIADSTRCLFETGVGRTEYASYFQENEPVEILVTSGMQQQVLTAVPHNMQNWQERLSFVLLEDADVSVGSSGKITITKEIREQVLTLPAKAVHSANSGDYVYVLGEQGIPEVKWIETGLHTGTQVEITGGLEEGEYVILK